MSQRQTKFTWGMLFLVAGLSGIAILRSGLAEKSTATEPSRAGLSRRGPGGHTPVQSLLERRPRDRARPRPDGGFRGSGESDRRSLARPTHEPRSGGARGIGRGHGDLRVSAGSIPPLPLIIRSNSLIAGFEFLDHRIRIGTEFSRSAPAIPVKIVG